VCHQRFYWQKISSELANLKRIWKMDEGEVYDVDGLLDTVDSMAVLPEIGC
jgi:hypothetical protein